MPLAHSKIALRPLASACSSRRFLRSRAYHIQDYYAYEMNVRKVSANTVKALSYAYKTDLIQTNPADKVELPTIDKFVGHFYNAAQLE